MAFTVLIMLRFLGFSSEENCVLPGNKKSGYKKVSKGIKKNNIIDLQYHGYFLSPYEDRILILFSEGSRGIEKTDHYNLNFSGCNINKKTF